MDRNEKLLEIFENEEFKAAAEGIASAEELRELFAKHGLELTLDEINDLFARAAKCMKEGELDEEDLEDVAGGGSLALVGINVGIGWLIKNSRKIKDIISLPVLPRQPKKPGLRM